MVFTGVFVWSPFLRNISFNIKRKIIPVIYERRRYSKGRGTKQNRKIKLSEKLPGICCLAFRVSQGEKVKRTKIKFNWAFRSAVFRMLFLTIVLILPINLITLYMSTKAITKIENQISTIFKMR
jgi:hypothetical protein